MKFHFTRKFVVLALVAAALFIQSCHKDSDPVVKAGQDGFFIINEGGYPNTNSSISFFDKKAGTVTNDVFIAKNGRALGEQAQSMTIANGKGYIVVQGSGKIEVINVDDYSSVTTLSDSFPSPRYLLAVSSTKAYVSDWGADGISGTVKILDLTTNKVTKSIPIGEGTNRMLQVGNLVYVANQGGYGKDNTVKVIDTNTDAVVNTIVVGDNPEGFQRDKNGNIWVVSNGYTAYNSDYTAIDEANSSKGSLSKITSDNKEALRLSVDQVAVSPSNINISPDGTQLYYTYSGGVYTMSTSATALPTSPLLSVDYYGLAVDPVNGNIIGCKAPNFNAAGTIDIYNSTGTLQNTYTVGIGPNGCTFK